MSREAVGAFILAGGESSRMGCAKGLLPLAGKPAIIRTAHLLEEVTASAPVIVGPPGEYAGLGFRVIADYKADGKRGVGPLGGIATALRASSCGWNLIVGCDLPFLTREWLEFLISRALRSPADAVLPLNSRGYEPLCAMYRKRAESAISKALDEGVRKITDALERVTLSAIAPEEWKAFDPRGMLFKNMNTPTDYEEARRLAGESEA